ncbi:MAG: hypothetical protein RLZZ502_1671, partial [Pseudomonadota bacterium]
RLGAATDSSDLEGQITARSDFRPTNEQIVATLAKFTGTIDQTPPAHSAIKIDGKRAYELARAGEAVEMKSRQVHIHEICLIAHHQDELLIRVRCSKGTYIRSLARDLGVALGCLAHLTALRREASGGFTLSEAVAIEQFRAHPHIDHLLSSDALLLHLPALSLSAAQSDKLLLGQSIALAPPPPYSEHSHLRCYDPANKLLGVVSLCQEKINPIRLIKQIN